MANGNYAKLIIRVSILGMILAGCEGQSMDQIFGIGDANNPADSPSIAPTPKPTPTPTPPPTPTPKPDGMSAIQKRNLAFDHERTSGIVSVYNVPLDVDVAEGHFNKAVQIRPDDKSAKLWLDAIAQARERRDAQTRALTALPGVVSALNNLNDALGKAAPAPAGKFQNPPAAAAAGGVANPPAAPPAVVNPNLVHAANRGGGAAANSVDPRLVF